MSLDTSATGSFGRASRSARIEARIWLSGSGACLWRRRRSRQRLEVEPAGCAAAGRAAGPADASARGRPRCAVPLPCLDQLVDEAADLARVARRLPRCLSSPRRVPRAPSSAGTRRAPRSGTARSGRASARWCRARRCACLGSCRGFSVRRRDGIGAAGAASGANAMNSRRALTVTGWPGAPAPLGRGRARSRCATLRRGGRPASNRNVLRMTPMWALPYSTFSSITSNALHQVSSVSATSGNGRSCLSRNFSCEATRVARDADDRRSRACGISRRSRGNPALRACSRASLSFG